MGNFYPKVVRQKMGKEWFKSVKLERISFEESVLSSEEKNPGDINRGFV